MEFMAFKVTEVVEGKSVRLQFLGSIDEHGTLPSHPEAESLTVDCCEITALNSIGIRIFLKWSKDHSHINKIILTRCPPVLTRIFSMISGFLAPNMVVTSFFVPYYSEATDEQTTYELVLNRDFSNGQYTLPAVKDSAGNLMEPDVTENFFSFLKK